MAQETNYEYRSLVERVAHAHGLAASPKLQKFFLYVASCALEDHPEAVTEQQIGVHVFGKRAGYNSSEDSIVRSQARLLRQKLASYFEQEGRHEPIVVTIPKGQYLPRFDPRVQPDDDATGLTVSHPSDPEIDPEAATEKAESSRRFTPARTIWIASVALFVFGIALGLGWRTMRTVRLTRSNALWRPFLTSVDPPLVIYSNPTFVGDPFTGLRIRQEADPTAAGKPAGSVDETYTGTGEAEAIHQITRFFDEREAAFILKRTKLVTWDEARSRNLIFIGAPSQNTSLQDLPNTTTFRIRLDERNQGYIENVRPQPGEPTRFPQAGTTGEYAIVALLPGPDPQKRVLILSGLTTNGTQAAAEFVSSEQGSSDLINLAGRVGDGIHPFEAILHVRISQGVPIDSEVAYLHKR